MRKTEFKDAMVKYAEKYGEVSITMVDKPNDNYTGLTIKKVGVPMPVVNLDMLYNRYIDADWSLNKCYEFVDHVLNQKMETPIDIKQVTEWDNARNRLYIRLCGTEVEGLSRKMEDMYLVPYLQMTEDGSATVRVTKELADCWNVDEDTVFNTAMRNQEVIRPLEIKALEDVIGMNVGLPVYIVSTKSGVCGAGAIFYDGVFDTLKEKLNEDFFIIPSSIHEVLVMAKSLNSNVKELVDMVTLINGEEVDERDRLTNSIYTFDFEDREFRKVG